MKGILVGTRSGMTWLPLDPHHAIRAPWRPALNGARFVCGVATVCRLGLDVAAIDAHAVTLAIGRGAIQL